MARVDNKTTRRTLEVFEAFHQRRTPMSLTELARVLRAPISSCHGIVRTLIARGYLYNVDAERNLYPTKRLLRIAETIAGNDPVLRLLTSSLSRLRDLSGETLVLGKWQNNVVVYLDVVESRQTIRYSAQPGDRQPVYFSSIGKAILAQMDGESLAAWLAANPLDRQTVKTGMSVRQLRQELKAARASGYCVAGGETTKDVMAVAVAISSGTDAIGVAIAGPHFRIKPAARRHGALLLKLRQEIAAHG
ncbi:MAG: IclR family transcriptional regulator [Reyranellales bacterium]